jgi:hypothetical protein
VWRRAAAFVAALCVATAVVESPVAQTVFVPDANPSSGTCSVVPFGADDPASPFADQVVQILLTNDRFGSAAGVVTDLSFASCATGRLHFDELRVTVGTTSATVLSSDFAGNLGASTVEVLRLRDHDWPLVADQWRPLGIQIPFVVDGSANLVVEFRTRGASWVPEGGGGVGTPGFHAATSIPRAVAIGVGDVPPTQASTVDMAGPKVALRFGLAGSGRYGVGCAGGSGIVPFAFVASPAVLGQTLVFGSFGPPATFRAMLLGLDTRAPLYPIDLAPGGMPGCRLYHDVALGAQGGFADGAGVSAATIPVPPVPGLVGLSVYAQAVVLDGGRFGLTDYARAVVGV